MYRTEFTQYVATTTASFIDYTMLNCNDFIEALFYHK